MNIASFLIGYQAAQNADSGGAASGGGSLPAGAYWEILDIKRIGTYDQSFVKFNGELYGLYNKTSGNSAFAAIYKYSEDAATWTKIADSPFTTWGSSSTVCCNEHNGKLHFTSGGESNVHMVFDGSTIIRLADIPNRCTYNSAFVQNNTLKAYSYYDGKVYAWDEATDTWAAEAVVGSKYEYREFYNVNGAVYMIYSKKVCSYENGTLTQLNTFSESIQTSRGCAIGDCLYLIEGKYNFPGRLVKYDASANQVSYVGLMSAEGSASFFEHGGSLVHTTVSSGGYVVPMKLHHIEATE